MSRCSRFTAHESFCLDSVTEPDKYIAGFVLGVVAQLCEHFRRIERVLPALTFRVFTGHHSFLIHRFIERHHVSYLFGLFGHALKLGRLRGTLPADFYLGLLISCHAL